jgi:hypothetical protein
MVPSQITIDQSASGGSNVFVAADQTPPVFAASPAAGPLQQFGRYAAM